MAAIKDKVPHFRGLKNTDTDVGLVTGAFARLGRDFRIFAGQRFWTSPGNTFEVDERIESRIDQAAKEQTPWQFVYVLRGGNRKAREMLGAA